MQNVPGVLKHPKNWKGFCSSQTYCARFQDSRIRMGGLRWAPGSHAEQPAQPCWSQDKATLATCLPNQKGHLSPEHSTPRLGPRRVLNILHLNYLLFNGYFLKTKNGLFLLLYYPTLNTKRQSTSGAK